MTRTYLLSVSIGWLSPYSFSQKMIVREHLLAAAAVSAATAAAACKI